MQGKNNWVGLSNYLVKPSDMELSQTYATAKMQASVFDKLTQGVIKGGQLSVVSGLTIRIAAGSAIMPNGQLVDWVQTDITLSAADPTNPRLDRIELQAVSTNNTTVIDEAGLNKILDITQVTSIAALAGTPAGSPALPAATVGKISLGYALVPATAVALINGNLFQNPYSGYDQAAYILGAQFGYIRFNANSSQYEVSNDNISWQQIQTSVFQNNSATIANNQVAVADVTNFLLDTSKGKGYRISVQITRETSLTKLRSYGFIDFVYNENTTSWNYVPSLIGDVDISGLALSVALVSGTVSKLQYTSDNMSGTGYTGTMKFSVKDIL